MAVPLYRVHYQMNKFAETYEQDYRSMATGIEQFFERSPIISQSPSRELHEGTNFAYKDNYEPPFKHLGYLGYGVCVAVDKVEDTMTRGIFARKLIQRYHGENTGRWIAISKEVNIIRRMFSHPHIVNIFATYSRKRNFAFFLNPVADGGDLSSYLVQNSDSGRPLSIEIESVLVRAFGCLANSLAFIHKHTIQHKGIKPQNILIHQGHALYTGLVIAFDGTVQGSTITTGDAVAYTRRYCPLEVANGDKRNKKSDIFSLGCVYLEILERLEPNFSVGLDEGVAYHEIADDLVGQLPYLHPFGSP